MLLSLAALLPALFWDGGPETADQLKRAGITEAIVPAHLEAVWKTHQGFSIRTASPEPPVKLPTPGVQYRMNQAGATRSPWVDSNGWSYLRHPRANFVYEAPGAASALAAAEAYMYGAPAAIRTDAAGLEPLARILEFLRQLKPAGLLPLANIGFIDDGSPQAGEIINLLVRRNLLVRVVEKPDRSLDLNVDLGSSKYPKAEAANPSAFAQKVRFELTDEKRALRVYGSEVVIGRLTGDERRMRVHLLNYAAASRPVRGLRVRVRGRYTTSEVSVFGIPRAVLVDYETQANATEFTLPDLKSYAVIDLVR